MGQTWCLTLFSASENVRSGEGFKLNFKLMLFYSDGAGRFVRRAVKEPKKSAESKKIGNESHGFFARNWRDLKGRVLPRTAFLEEEECRTGVSFLFACRRFAGLRLFSCVISSTPYKLHCMISVQSFEEKQGACIFGWHTKKVDRRE